MPITFLNLAMLAGLVAVLIPPLIHLLNRKRFDVVRWGAMRFLQVSERTRRKVFLEELLLMLIRMGLIALMVIALAAAVRFQPLARLSRRPRPARCRAGRRRLLQHGLSRSERDGPRRCQNLGTRPARRPSPRRCRRRHRGALSAGTADRRADAGFRSRPHRHSDAARSTRRL